MRTATKSTVNAQQKRRDLNRLGWKIAGVRDLDYTASVKLLGDLESGSVVITPAEASAEVERYLSTVRCHAKCMDWVREYGKAPYKSSNPKYHLDPSLCEVCALPMTCTATDGNHQYVELSQSECRRRGIYHGGNCYHVSQCSHCGHLHAVDSSG